MPQSAQALKGGLRLLRQTLDELLESEVLAKVPLAAATGVALDHRREFASN